MTPPNDGSHVPRSILIVEDTDDMREAYVIAFEQASYRVVAVDSVGAALGILRKGHFDVLLTDYALGDGTGLDILRDATAERLLERTHLILCTAHRHVTAPLGVCLLHKPIGFDELMEAAEANGQADIPAVR